jgi:glyoxylase-like metal-dependent hydrolase (beta-lactamase superfamily II)
LVTALGPAQREPGVLFCSDLISNDGDRELAFVPAEFHEDPAETRHSVERLLELDFSILCLDHGVPLADDPKAAIRNLLATTR